MLSFGVEEYGPESDKRGATLQLRSRYPVTVCDFCSLAVCYSDSMLSPLIEVNEEVVVAEGYVYLQMTVMCPDGD